MKRVRGLLFGGLVGATLIAVVAVPAASARSSARVRLSVLPLPASSLGSAASSLPLQGDSGVVTNNYFQTGFGLPTTPNRWFASAPFDPAKLGRISGYALDYGHGASGSTGVTEVWTSVDKYKTSAAAKKGLGSWRRWETNLYLASHFRDVFSVSVEKQKIAALGSSRFAVLVGYSGADVAPLFGLDEQFTVGRYEADVTVWAGSAAAAKKLAPRLAKKLETRVKLALAGRLHAKPVKLPPAPKAGPPPGGPDLAQLALNTTDVSGQATISSEDYQPWLFVLSGYGLFMSPAGQFNLLEQYIAWYPTANEASFNADAQIGQLGPGSLDLSSIGDGARGFLSNGSSGGLAVLGFSSGQLTEFLVMGSLNAIQPSQAESIAHIVADKIDAAGLGS
jgi:hypothetical protein